MLPQHAAGPPIGWRCLIRLASWIVPRRQRWTALDESWRDLFQKTRR
jgi:hypothetical protein